MPRGRLATNPGPLALLQQINRIAGQIGRILRRVGRERRPVVAFEAPGEPSPPGALDGDPRPVELPPDP